MEKGKTNLDMIESSLHQWWMKKPAKLDCDDENDAIWWEYETIAELYNEWVDEKTKGGMTYQ